MDIKKVIYKNPFMAVNMVSSPQTGNGEFITFCRNKTKTGAVIVPVTPDGEVILIKEYRIGADVETIAVPKGAADVEGEPAESIVSRELREELGMSFERLDVTPLIAYPLPAFANFSGQVVIAHGVTVTGKTELEDGEVIEVYKKVRIPQLIAMLKRGEINDAESVMALQHYVLEELTKGL